MDCSVHDADLDYVAQVGDESTRYVYGCKKEGTKAKALSVRVSVPDTTRENGSWDFMVCADMMRISWYVYPEMNPQLPERKAWLDMDGWT